MLARSVPSCARAALSLPTIRSRSAVLPGRGACARGAEPPGTALHAWARGSASTPSGGGLPGGAPAAGPAPPTPRSLGFRMPGEWEPHAGTWMSFPHDPALWREDARPAQQQVAEVARAIAQFEPVWVLADPRVASLARSHFRGTPGVEVVEQPTNDVWARDWGPTCVVRDGGGGRREVAAVSWNYNCYGSPVKIAAGEPVLMHDWALDRAAGRSLAPRAGLRAFECPLVLEGGSVHSDGQGTLLVTEECLRHPSRNPGLSREAIEALLKEHLGAERVLWLWKGMVGDEKGTNGHIDNMSAFAEPGTVLLAWSDDPNDPLHEVATRNLEILQAPGQHDAAGRRLRVIKVPSPSPPLFMTYREAMCDRAAANLYSGTAVPVGWRLPGSYLNHYVVNGGVVVPQFGGAQERSDAEALRVLAAAYPGRRVVGVQSREVLLGGGNIHCLTQQLPAADVLARP